jgi:VIT1/CCC1 family predicted Fe2+/Mn2+ transporter
VSDAVGIEHHHRDLRGGGARAAVFGFSDGLVTNISLILGIAGAHPASSVVRLAGIAGLVAGAFSMAAGEFVSMQAQRELFQRELDVERRALKDSPHQERAELVEIYKDRGIDPTVAQDLVAEVMQDPELALETHAREELGIDPGALGRPFQAAGASFAAFAGGAFVPLLPWLLSSGAAATIASIAAAAVVALATGALLGALSNRPRWRSAVRQLVIGAVAAGVTYGIGRLVGVGMGH